MANTILQARFDKMRLNKLEAIKSATGFSTSEVFRRLVDAAEIQPAKINVNLSANANDDIARQGSNVVVAA